MVVTSRLLQWCDLVVTQILWWVGVVMLCGVKECAVRSDGVMVVRGVISMLL